MNQQTGAGAFWDGILTWVTVQGVNILLALAVLVAGWWAIGIFRRAFRRWIERTDHMDPIVEEFLASLLYYGSMALLFIVVLSLMGVQTTSLIAVLGAASLAVALALQGSLTSLAAGVMIILLRPIRIGDYIEVNGEAGTVKSISLFLTELATYDNVQKLLPNSSVWGSAVTNYSVYATRLLDIEIGISYGDDIDKALTVLRRVAEADDKVLADPAPNAFVAGMGASSVDLTLRIWVPSSDYWPLRRALTKTVKEEIEAAGLSIPFPHRQIIMASGGSGAGAGKADHAGGEKAA
ncbi:MAG: mechanosensitive ion channel family protein [Pseudomonadota bacterium]